ncbi:hypothetical protein HMPREF0841_1869 [Streptococcus pyogenes ATCC 10782]|nr:hypothetical protein HMPREF0841_1869 [Streptococcus pyogenes ATCC 10782]
MALWGWTEIKKIETRTSLHQNKSNADYRSFVIIQGANTDIVRLCRKTKKEREGFSPQNKKTSTRNAPLVKFKLK